VRDPDSGDSESEAPPPRRRTRAQRREASEESEASERPVPQRRRSSAKRARLDPDEESNAAATEEESGDEIELDEPERFMTATRLRSRGETMQQRMLRKLKNRRLNLPSSEEEDQDEASESASAWEYVRDDDDGFISEDDGEFDERLMPSEFSLGYAQSPEYKFKVMFQYLLLLVMHGPEVLPLRGTSKEYLAPVGELRAYVRGIRNLRVRSQIWRADFVKALETYPSFCVCPGKASADPRCRAAMRSRGTAMRATAETSTAGSRCTSPAPGTTTSLTRTLGLEKGMTMTKTKRRSPSHATLTWVGKPSYPR
jgi:hypothetical protein